MKLADSKLFRLLFDSLAAFIFWVLVIFIGVYLALGTFITDFAPFLIGGAK